MFSEPSGHRMVAAGRSSGCWWRKGWTKNGRTSSCTEAWGVCIWGVDAVAATVPQGRRTGWKEAESYREAGLFFGRCSHPAPEQSQTDISRTGPLLAAQWLTLWASQVALVVNKQSIASQFLFASALLVFEVLKNKIHLLTIIHTAVWYTGKLLR